MEKERLFKLCDRFSIEGAIGIVLSNHIDIGGDVVGVSVKNFEKAGKMLIEYSEKRSNPKRKPDTNGVLPLTEIELREFTKLFFDNKDVVNRVYYDGNCIVVEWKEPDNNEFGQLYLDEVSAILWLAERFELNGGE